MTDAVSSYLKPRIESIDWAKLSRSQRKKEWLQLCLSAVKRLERLLVELKTERRTEPEALYSVGTTGLHQSLPSLPTKRKADNRVEDPRMKRQNRRNRARRLAASAVRLPKSLLRMATSREVRTVTSDLPPLDSCSTEQERPVIRIRRLRISEAAERKHLATQTGGQAPLRIRRLSISEAVEKKRLTARLAAISERTQQHIKRQQLRSQRRMQLMCMRMQWNRQQQEKSAAGNDLWQQAQELQDGDPQQDNVWPLAQWQKEQLANEVQAFVRGKR